MGREGGQEVDCTLKGREKVRHRVGKKNVENGNEKGERQMEGRNEWKGKEG